MIELIFLFSLGIIWLIFASIQDLKEKEVANWISFSLIIFALGFRFFYCLFSFDMGGFAFFYQGLIGLGIFFILGHLFYYCMLFAGGDAKILIALGAVLPLSNSFFTNVSYFSIFMVIFLFIGAFYGLLISLFLVFKNYKSFKKGFVKDLKNSKKFLYFSVIFGVLLLVFSFVSILFFILGVLILIIPFMYVFARTIDDTANVRNILTSKLREGDWLYNDIKIGKKVVKAKWEGLSAREIKLLQGKKKFVKIRQGIAFIPVFLISFILFMVFFLVTKGFSFLPLVF